MMDETNIRPEEAAAETAPKAEAAQEAAAPEAEQPAAEKAPENGLKGPQVRQFPVHPMLPVVRTMKIPTGCISEEVMIFSWLFDVLVKR